MRNLLPLTAAVVAMASAMPALADASSTAIADFSPRYAALKVAMDDRDDKAIKALLTKDFEATDIQGEKRDADDMIASLAMMPIDPAIQTEVTLVSATIDGATARVVTKRTTRGSRQGQDGTVHKGEFVTVSDDTWVDAGGGKWLLKSTETQEVTIFRDGVQMRHFNKGDPIPPRGEGRRGPGGPGAAGGAGAGAPPPPPPAGN